MTANTQPSPSLTPFPYDFDKANFQLYSFIKASLLDNFSNVSQNGFIKNQSDNIFSSNWTNENGDSGVNAEFSYENSSQNIKFIKFMLTIASKYTIPTSDRNNAINQAYTAIFKSITTPLSWNCTSTDQQLTFLCQSNTTNTKGIQEYGLTIRSIIPKGSFLLISADSCLIPTSSSVFKNASKCITNYYRFN